MQEAAAKPRCQSSRVAQRNGVLLRVMIIYYNLQVQLWHHTFIQSCSEDCIFNNIYILQKKTTICLFQLPSFMSRNHGCSLGNLAVICILAPHLQRGSLTQERPRGRRPGCEGVLRHMTQEKNILCPHSPIRSAKPLMTHRQMARPQVHSQKYALSDE